MHGDPGIRFSSWLMPANPQKGDVLPPSDAVPEGVFCIPLSAADCLMNFGTICRTDSTPSRTTGEAHPVFRVLGARPQRSGWGHVSRRLTLDPVSGPRRSIPGVWGQSPQPVECDHAIGSLWHAPNGRVALRLLMRLPGTAPFFLISGGWLGGGEAFCWPDGPSGA